LVAGLLQVKLTQVLRTTIKTITFVAQFEFNPN